jgi:hypothetical protein
LDFDASKLNQSLLNPSKGGAFAVLVLPISATEYEVMMAFGRYR